MMRYAPYRSSTSSRSSGRHRQGRSSVSSGTLNRSTAARRTASRASRTEGSRATGGPGGRSIRGSGMDAGYDASASICRTMTGRGTQASAEPGHSLPVLDRLAPAPPPAILAAQIDLLTRPGDVVVDLAGRGGWVARAAIDRQRRGLSLESSPLTRMLAEVVLRPPDVRHLDAAFQGMAASPWRHGSLKTAIGDMYTTRCATCGRTLIAHEFTWSDDRQAGRQAAIGEPGTDEPGIRGGRIREAGTTTRATPKPAIPTKGYPVLRHYRCSVCRDQLGGGELRQAPLETDDLERATAVQDADKARATIRQRFPEISGAGALIDEMVALHTARQLVALAAILERIESDLREASVLAALRLSLLEAILPSSRLATAPGRAPLVRMAGGHVRLPSGTTFRERNPWLAFEEAFRTVRGFVQRLDGSVGPVQARLGEDLHALGEGHANAVLGLAASTGVLTVRDGTYSVGRTRSTPRVRLVIGQPPTRPSLDRLATAYHATAWVLGREAAALLPLEALSGSAIRPPWSWQAEAIGRSIESVSDTMARDSRVVQIVDPGPEALVAAVLGGASAGCRLLDVRLGDADERDAPAIVEMLPPGGLMPPGPRTRANVALESVAGGAGDPNVVPGRGLFSPPESVRDRPFSATDTARTVTATAVETLRARGEPASFDRLLGAILVGLDRAGQLRRLADASLPGASANGSDPDASGPESADAHGGRAWSGGYGRTTTAPANATPAPPSDRRGATARAHPRRDGPILAAEPQGDRERNLVAGRSAGRRERIGVLGRPARVGRVQPAVDGRAADRDRVLRTHREPVHGSRHARSQPRPGLPRQLPQSRQHGGPSHDRRRPSRPQPRAHRPHRPDRRGRSSPGDADLDRPPRAVAPVRIWHPWRPPGPDRRAPISRAPRSSGSGAPGRRRDLVRPRQARVPFRGRMDRDDQRPAPRPARAASRPTTT